MKSEKKVSAAEQKFLFYTYLVAFMRQDKFDEGLANVIGERKAKIGDAVSFEVSIERLVLLHREHYPGGDQHISNELLECVFNDLAQHFRSPHARMVFQNLLETMDGQDGLYAFPTNVRLLSSGDKAGFAVVTLVVNSYAALREELADGVMNNDFWLEQNRSAALLRKRSLERRGYDGTRGHFCLACNRASPMTHDTTCPKKGVQKSPATVAW